jgi:hypothetical protein
LDQYISRFPLWVKSRHGRLELRCPLYPQKRTFAGVDQMSAKCHKRPPALADQYPFKSANAAGVSNGASGRIVGLRHFCLRCSRGFPWQPSFFGSLPFLGAKVPQQLYSADDSTLLQGPPTIWTPPKECGCWPVAVPRAHTRPDFAPKVQMLGEPTGTAIDGHERQWWGRCWS